SVRAKLRDATNDAGPTHRHDANTYDTDERDSATANIAIPTQPGIRPGQPFRAVADGIPGRICDADRQPDRHDQHTQAIGRPITPSKTHSTTDYLARHSRSHVEKPFSHGSDTERHGREADLGTLFSLLPFSV